jgi:hypothetical protein
LHSPTIHRPARRAAFLAAVVAIVLTSGGSLTAAAAASAPSVSLTTPANGAQYVQDSTVKAHYACTDPDGDLTSCSGTVANGAPIDTSAGSYQFFVTAKDKAGNTRSQKVVYSVYVGGGGAPPPAPPSPSLKGTGPPSTETDGSAVTFDTGDSVSCPDKGKPCTSDASVRAKGTRIAQAHFAIPAGKRVRLRLKLSKDGAKRLRDAGKLRVTVTVKSRRGKGPAITDTKTITIRARQHPS